MSCRGPFGPPLLYLHLWQNACFPSEPQTAATEPPVLRPAPPLFPSEPEPRVVTHVSAPAAEAVVITNAPARVTQPPEPDVRTEVREIILTEESAFRAPVTRPEVKPAEAPSSVPSAPATNESPTPRRLPTLAEVREWVAKPVTPERSHSKPKRSRPHRFRSERRNHCRGSRARASPSISVRFPSRSSSPRPRQRFRLRRPRRALSHPPGKATRQAAITCPDRQDGAGSYRTSHWGSDANAAGAAHYGCWLGSGSGHRRTAGTCGARISQRPPSLICFCTKFMWMSFSGARAWTKGSRRLCGWCCAMW